MQRDQQGETMSALPRFAMGFAGSVLMLTGAVITTDRARAYTPEQQQACTDDAMRLCGAYVPDVDRITACMIQNKSQLTPRCAVYFQPPLQPMMTQGRARKPQNLKPRTNAAQLKPHKAKPASKAVSRADQ